jgi:ABC-type glycerol-3-phosphate transport system permease component
MLPLVANVFSTIMLINFIGLWNDYQTPLLFLPSHPTLAYGIYELSNSYLQGLNNVPMRMAGCIVMVLPILALFLAFKNKLMNNVSMGGIKE